MSDAVIGKGAKGPVLVTAAIIENSRGEILIAQRPVTGKIAGGLWELPGGKVEPGEDPSTCIVREIHEELGVEISLFSQKQCFGVYSYNYERGTDGVVLEQPIHIVLIVYRARLVSPESSISLNGVESVKWVSRSVKPVESFAPADIAIVADLWR